MRWPGLTGTRLRWALSTTATLLPGSGETWPPRLNGEWGRLDLGSAHPSPIPNYYQGLLLQHAPPGALTRHVDRPVWQEALVQYGPQEFQGLAAAARARHAGTGRTSSVILSSRRARCGISSTRPQAHCRSAPFSKALARHCQTSRLAGALTQYAPKRSSVPCCRAPVAPPLTTVPTCRRHLHWSPSVATFATIPRCQTS